MGNKFATEAFTLLAIAIVIIALRTIARWVTAGAKNLKLDDYAMPLAGVVYGLETGAAYIVGAWWKGLANNAMTDEQRRTLDPDSMEFHLRVGGSKTQLIGWSLYTLLLWMLKACMAIFYTRLTLVSCHLNYSGPLICIGSGCRIWSSVFASATFSSARLISLQSARSCLAAIQCTRTGRSTQIPGVCSFVCPMQPVSNMR
jgi:cbb3-type cytochrome oxidase subunit 3